MNGGQEEKGSESEKCHPEFRCANEFIDESHVAVDD